MRRFLLILSASFIVNLVFGQDIILTVEGKFEDESVSFKSILVENITNNTQILFNDLPQYEKYQINLTKKSFWGTTGINVQSLTNRFTIVRNKPGVLTFKNNGSAADFVVSVYNISGQKEHQFDKRIIHQYESVDVVVGVKGLHVVSIESPETKHAFRVLGKDGSNQFRYKNTGIDFAGSLKSTFNYNESDFSFLPGDNLKISVFADELFANPEIQEITNSAQITFECMQKAVEIVLEGQPEEISIESTPLRYNKKQAITYEQDDNLSGTVESMLSLFSGGIPEFDSLQSKGIYFTNGFDSLVTFKTNSVSWVYSRKGNQYWDWASKGEDTWASHVMSYNRLSRMIENGGSLVSHEFRCLDEADDEIVSEVPKEYVNWLENLYGIRPFSFVKGGGHTFNENLWADAWFQQGALVGVIGSKANKDILRVDTIDFATLEHAIIMGRYSLDEKELPEMVSKVVGLMNLNNENWLRLYSHNITDGGDFADYWKLKEFFTYIENSFGRFGSDDIWVPSVGEIIQYFHVRDNISYRLSDSDASEKKQLIIDQSLIPEYVRERAISFIISSNKKIDEIELVGYDARYKRIDDYSFLIDIDLN